MDWLKDHSYLATWISAFIAVTMAFAKLLGKLQNVDWRELMGIILFLTAVAVVMSPVFDAKARDFANTLVFFMFGFGILHTFRGKR